MKPLQQEKSDPRPDSQHHAAVTMWVNRTKLAEWNGSSRTEVANNRIRGAPCKVGLFIDLSKVHSKLVLHTRGGDLQHPCSGVQLPLNGRHPWHRLHAPPHSLLTD